jgi:hypothetical protein
VDEFHMSRLMVPEVRAGVELKPLSVTLMYCTPSTETWMTSPLKLISTVCREVPTLGRLAVAMAVVPQVAQSENFNSEITDVPG